MKMPLFFQHKYLTHALNVVADELVKMITQLPLYCLRQYANKTQIHITFFPAWFILIDNLTYNATVESPNF